MSELPSAVAQFFAASNAGDSETFLAAFADDALLNDTGREFRGRSGISQWNDNENIGVQTQFAVGKASEDLGATTVAVGVSGNGYNGEATFTFVVTDGRISHLVIA
jgi:ketosteroid isomerase-like protein